MTADASASTGPVQGPTGTLAHSAGSHLFWFLGLLVLLGFIRGQLGLAMTAQKIVHCRCGGRRVVFRQGSGRRTRCQSRRGRGPCGVVPRRHEPAVDALTREYGRIAMVGDGVNDVPALAAHVRMTMGVAGSDVDLIAGDLAKLPYLSASVTAPGASFVKASRGRSCDQRAGDHGTRRQVVAARCRAGP